MSICGSEAIAPKGLEKENAQRKGGVERGSTSTEGPLKGISADKETLEPAKAPDWKNNTQEKGARERGRGKSSLYRREKATERGEQRPSFGPEGSWVKRGSVWRDGGLAIGG